MTEDLIRFGDDIAADAVDKWFKALESKNGL